MSNLVIDIGNTALKASWCDGLTLGKTFRYQGEKIIDFILSLTLRTKPEVIVLSSVRSITPKNLQLLEKECGRLILVDKDMMSHYGLPSYITPDRVASIVASRYLFKGKECMIFDFGTTLTVDFINAEGEYIIHLNDSVIKTSEYDTPIRNCIFTGKTTIEILPSGNVELKSVEF
jgi:type III pantothenate kinase